MTGLLKWGALAFGAYWLYEQGYLAQLGLAPVGAAAAGAPGGPINVGSSAQPSASTSAPASPGPGSSSTAGSGGGGVQPANVNLNPPGGVVATTPAAPAGKPVSISDLIRAAGGSPIPGPGVAPLMLNADQWNHFYSGASGVKQTTDLFPAGKRTALMPAEEYFYRRNQAGLSGLAQTFDFVSGTLRSRGLGALADAIERRRV